MAWLMLRLPYLKVSCSRCKQADFTRRRKDRKRNLDRSCVFAPSACAPCASACVSTLDACCGRRNNCDRSGCDRNRLRAIKICRGMTKISLRMMKFDDGITKSTGFHLRSEGSRLITNDINNVERTLSVIPEVSIKTRRSAVIAGHISHNTKRSRL
jgi:hypothetical protein